MEKMDGGPPEHLISSHFRMPEELARPVRTHLFTLLQIGRLYGKTTYLYTGTGIPWYLIPTGKSIDVQCIGNSIPR